MQPYHASHTASPDERSDPRGAGAPPAGEHPTFEALFAAYHAPIHSYVRRLMGNGDDADDLTQETFVKLYRALPRFRPGHVQAWVYRIATNTCLDELRHRTLVRWQPWDAFSPLQVDQVARDNPERDALQEETRHEVGEVLNRLSPRYRDALVLREYHGLGHEEIALALGTTRTAVKTLLQRARAQFRLEWIDTHGRPPFAPRLVCAGDAVTHAG